MNVIEVIFDCFFVFVMWFTYPPHKSFRFKSFFNFKPVNWLNNFFCLSYSWNMFGYPDGMHSTLRVHVRALDGSTHSFLADELVDLKHPILRTNYIDSVAAGRASVEALALQLKMELEAESIIIDKVLIDHLSFPKYTEKKVVTLYPKVGIFA